jgi:hypothetical protein
MRKMCFIYAVADELSLANRNARCPADLFMLEMQARAQQADGPMLSFPLDPGKVSQSIKWTEDMLQDLQISGEEMEVTIY